MCRSWFERGTDLEQHPGPMATSPGSSTPTAGSSRHGCSLKMRCSLMRSLRPASSRSNSSTRSRSSAGSQGFSIKLKASRLSSGAWTSSRERRPSPTRSTRGVQWRSRSRTPRLARCSDKLLLYDALSCLFRLDWRSLPFLTDVCQCDIRGDPLWRARVAQAVRAGRARGQCERAPLAARGCRSIEPRGGVRAVTAVGVRLPAACSRASYLPFCSLHLVLQVSPSPHVQYSPDPNYLTILTGTFWSTSRLCDLAQLVLATSAWDDRLHPDGPSDKLTTLD